MHVKRSGPASRLLTRCAQHLCNGQPMQLSMVRVQRYKSGCAGAEAHLTATREQLDCHIKGWLCVDLQCSKNLAKASCANECSLHDSML